MIRPAPGDIRQIFIEKSSEQLGITIEEGGAKKGVFVSSVSENSLASQVGLQVTDNNYFIQNLAHFINSGNFCKFAAFMLQICIILHLLSRY